MVPAPDLELVDLALAEIGNEQFPDAGGATISHRMAAAVPVVEVSDHAHALGVGRPDREVHAPETLVRAEVSAQPLEVSQVGSLAEKMKIEIGKDGPEAVGVDQLPAVPLVILELQAVSKRLGPVRKNGLKKPVGVDLLHRHERSGLAVRQIDDMGRARFGEERPHHPVLQPVAISWELMKTQYRERIPVIRMDGHLDVRLRRDRPLFRHHSHDS